MPSAWLGPGATSRCHLLAWENIRYYISWYNFFFFTPVPLLFFYTSYSLLCASMNSISIKNRKSRVFILIFLVLYWTGSDFTLRGRIHFSGRFHLLWTPGRVGRFTIGSKLTAVVICPGELADFGTSGLDTDGTTIWKMNSTSAYKVSGIFYFCTVRQVSCDMWRKQTTLYTILNHPISGLLFKILRLCMQN